MPHIFEAPVLQISRFYTGLYTFRNPLVVPIRQFGRRLIELYDAIIAGSNMEITNLLTLKRRPGYTAYNSNAVNGVPLAFYSFKPSSFPGQVFPIVDTTADVEYLQPGSAALSVVKTKSVASQTNFCGIGPYMYMGNPNFSLKWDGPAGPQGVTNWGIAIGSLNNATGPNGPGAGADVAASGSLSVWANPGNIVLNDGNFATTTVPASGGSASQGPSACTSTVAGGWSNPNNIKVQDGSYATISIAAHSNSGDIQAKAFGFTIPLSATVLGITATVIRGDMTGGGSISDNDVTLLKAGVAAGSNLAAIGVWGAPPDPHTYGGSSNLWGTTWTPSDINNSGFGIQVSAHNSDVNPATAGIDFISLTVTYSLPTGTNVSDYLQGTQFGFAIPSTTTISGILVEVKGLQSQISLTNVSVQMLKAGALIGTAKVNELPASNAFLSFGGTGDLWGTTWTANDINQTTFGVSIQGQNASGANCSFSVDYVRITIYGVGGPSVSLVGGSLTAQNGYQYQFCYGNSNSGHVSSPTPPSSTVIPSSQNVQISLTASTDPQVNQIRLFRTTDGGGQPFFELPNSPFPNTTAVVTDSAPDNTLQITNICPLPHFNDPPPAGLVDPVWFSGRLWGHVGNLLYFASGPDITMGNGQEAWYPVYVFSLPTTIIRKFPLPNGMLVVTTDDIYVVRGIDTISFTVNEFMRDIGMRNWNAADSDGSNIYIYTTDRQMLLINGNGVQSISSAVSDVIANVDPSAAYVSIYRYTAKNTMLFLGDGTTNIYPYNLQQQAWCPIQTPAGGVQAIGTIETQVGVWNFLRGKNVSSQTVAQRSLTTFSDEGSTYTCSATFGPIVLADFLTLAELKDMVIATASGQSSPSVSVLANEISGNFQGLGSAVTSEPPELSATPSQSVSINRYTWQNAALPELMNFYFMQLAWPSAATADELYVWTSGGTQPAAPNALGQPGQLPQLQGR